MIAKGKYILKYLANCLINSILPPPQLYKIDYQSITTIPIITARQILSLRLCYFAYPSTRNDGEATFINLHQLLSIFNKQTT